MMQQEMGTEERRWNILAKIESVFLGDNPFFGVDHLSQERAREKASQSQNFDNMLEVMDYSLNAGAKGMVVSTHPKLKNFIDYGISRKPNLINKIEFFPILPYVQGYVLKVNEKGLLRTIMDLLSPPVGFQRKLKIMTKGGLGAIKKDFFELFKVLIDTELIRIQNLNIKKVFLHDVLTDLALSLNLRNAFKVFQEHLHDEYDIEAGLVTKNFPKLVYKLDEWNLNFATLMTSFNKVGFQMNPSRESCENCLLDYRGDIIAMSVLAGGYLRLNEAYEYVLSQPKIKNVVIGISSIAHAKSTLQLLLNKET
ncbi:MAG: hypothetical protein M3044_19360 [Thermoproteota archaeon]|nr:hypothetical protein [Thermoproteota archaeon]